MKQGELVRELSSSDLNSFRAPRGASPKEGSTVRLWRMDGVWSVWSTGPETGTWWLKAVDEDARVVANRLTTEGDSLGEPVVRRVWRDCIAVRSNEIRRPGVGAL